MKIKVIIGPRKIIFILACVGEYILSKVVLKLPAKCL